MSSLEDPRLQSLLARWRALAHSGKALSLEGLCWDCPDLLDPLKELILVELVCELDEAKAQGRALSVEQLCQERGCPEFIPNLKVLRRSDHNLQLPLPEPPVKTALAQAQVVPVPEGYELCERLGVGQFGEVFRARAPGGVEVAVKRIKRPVQDEASQREMRALELIRSLHHPYLLQTQAYWVLQEQIFIVMELAEQSLEGWLEQCQAQGQQGIPPGPLLNYFTQVAEALDYLHARGIIHRDVKPANLLLVQHFAKVADFGLVRLLRDSVEVATFCGTPAYMGPETFRRRASFQSDQYSLAVTYLQMRLGLRTQDLAERNLASNPDLSGLLPEEQKVLLRALARDPHQRFRSCKAFIAALSEVFAPPQELEANEKPSLFRRLIPAVGLLVFLLTLLIGGSGPPPGSKPPREEIWLPPGCRPAADSKIDRVTQPPYYQHIVRPLPGAADTLVSLVLVRRINPNDPPTFYIMRDKVTWEQFHVALRDPAFLKSLTEAPEGTVLRSWGKARPDNPRVPMMDVTAMEAHLFAAWLGGQLPSGKEWDKAGGRFEGETNPCKVGWKKDGIAVSAVVLAITETCPWTSAGLALQANANLTPEIALRLQAPWPVGQASDDVSIYGCRDMAGNGKEYTRNEVFHFRPEPFSQPKQDDWFDLRGAAFWASDPYRFGDIAGSIKQGDPSYDTGFRVVLPILR